MTKRTLDNAAGRRLHPEEIEVVSTSGCYTQADRKQLEAELRKHYTDLHKAGQWTEDWDAYEPIGWRNCGMGEDWTRCQYHDVVGSFTSCVRTFLVNVLGWYKGSKSRRYDGRQVYPARPLIRYTAFSGDYAGRPNRVALARTLERLHWIAGMEPPTWEQVRSKELCVQGIERFRLTRGTPTPGGVCFASVSWCDYRGEGKAPRCHQCARAGVVCEDGRCYSCGMEGCVEGTAARAMSQPRTAPCT